MNDHLISGNDVIDRSAQENSEPWMLTVASLEPFDMANMTHRRKAPETSIHTSWVFGVQTGHARSNVHLTAAGDLVYFVGRFGVVFDWYRRQQRLFTGHADEISCLAIHPNADLVASGEVNESTLLCWDVLSRRVIFRDCTFQRGGIQYCTFSKDGRLVASVGRDIQQTAVVHNWKDNKVSTHCLGSSLCGFTTRIIPWNSQIKIAYSSLLPTPTDYLLL
jgi:WD40 repeat protein